MSRSDGTFPSYTRLEIDPHLWPEHYWDRSRRCKTCEALWPNTHIFTKSPCCDADTLVVEQPPDMRWPEAVAALLKSKFDKWYEEYNEGTSDEQLAWDEETIKREIASFLDEVAAQPETIR